MNDIATQYAKDVVCGGIPACRKLKLACKRHLNDLKQSKSDDFPYTYLLKHVHDIVTFLKIMPDVNTGITLKPAPFQIFILSMIFGWRTKEGNHPKYNQILISMSRTNSKTMLLSYITLYKLIKGAPKYNKQIIVLAKAMKQAQISFAYACTVVNILNSKSSYLKKLLDVNSDQIRDKKHQNYIKPYASDSSTLDGLHPSLTVVDEYHELRSRAAINSIQSGIIQNPDAQLIEISTAGFNTGYPMYSDVQLYTSMLEGKVDLPNVLFLCWEQDSEKEINDPTTWEKSNPLICIPEKKQILVEHIKQKRDIALKQGSINSVIVKNFNMWRSQEADNAYLSIKDWKATHKNNFNIDGRDVYVGVDLSKSDDSSSLSFVYPYINEDGQRCWYFDSHSFISSTDGIEKHENADGIPYRDLEEKGQCNISKLSSGIIDVSNIYEWLCNYVEEHQLNIILICYDSWNFNLLLTQIDKNNKEWTLLPVRQGTFTLNTPTRTFRQLLLNRQITHSDNKILENNFMNAVVLEDNNGIKLDKDHANFKIDAADACITAFSQAILYFDRDQEENEDEFKNWNDEKLNDYFANDFSF